MAIPEEIQEQVLAEATSATPNYTVDMNSQQFKDVDAAIKGMEDELDNTYAGQIGGADKFYQDLANQSQQWADKQAEIQKEQTDFTIEKIEQQKEQAEKDYIKEQSGAYVDWQKQSNAYGVNAEKMASAGLTNTGYSESSQVSMYNAYQNRVATAREVMNQAKIAYDNNMKEAMLQNNAVLAEIYANAYKEQLQLALDSYLHNQELVLELSNKKMELENIKWNRYQDVLQQINTQNALAEEVRQYQETMKWNTEQKELDRQHDKDLEEIKYGYEKSLKEIQHGYDKKLAEIEQKYKLAYLAADTQAKKDLLDKELEIAKDKLEAERKEQEKLLKYEYDLKKQSVGTVSGSSGSSGSGGNNTSSGGVLKKTATQITVNMDSVLALGYGPISATKLAELEASGKITSYVKDGQRYYKNAPVSAISQSTLSKYGSSGNGIYKRFGY